MSIAGGAPATIVTGAPHPVPAAAMSRHRRHRPNLGRLAPYGFLAPFFLSFTLFFFVPSCVSLAVSLYQYRGYGRARFIGFANYAALFGSPTFWQAVRNTAFYWLAPMLPILVLAFLLALAVRSPLIRLGRVYKPLLFIPQVMAPVAAALVWRVVLSRDGVVNAILGTHIGWLSEPALGKWSVSLLLIWRALGWYFVIFLATLTSISPDLLEAAEVDGANATRRVRHIVLPLMRPTFLFAIVIDTIGGIQLFTEPNLLLGTGASAVAPPTGAPIMNQVINNVNGGQFGLASAAGWVIFATIGLISVFQFRTMRERQS